MAKSASAQKFMFTRSFDDPSKLYLPGERNRAEREAAEAAEAAAIAERERKAAQKKAQALADAERHEAQSEKPPQEEMIYTQSELDAAREEGHIAGHTAALEEAETAREHYIADAKAGIGGLVGRTVADVERDLIIDTLKHTLGNRTHAAKILGISIRTLRNKLNTYVQDGTDVPAPGTGET